jgi:hypothetical protein
MSTLNGSRREIIAGSPSPPPHLVMVPTPGLGHENPFLPAARRIADEGHCHLREHRQTHLPGLEQAGVCTSEKQQQQQLPASALRELPGWNGSRSGKRILPNHANPRSGNEANSAVGGSGDRPLFTRDREDAICCVCTSSLLHSA